MTAQNKDKEYNRRKKADQLFLDRFQYWLDEKLALMPCETSEDKKARWEYYNIQLWTADFTKYAINIVAPGISRQFFEYDKILDEAANSDNEEIKSSKKVERFDNEAFFKALKECIETYTGFTKTEHHAVSFPTMINQKYKQKNQEKKNSINDSIGGMTGFSQNSKDNAFKTMALIKQWAAAMNCEVTPAIIERYAQEEHLTANLKDLLLHMINSVEHPTDPNDEENSSGVDHIPDYQGCNPEEIVLNQIQTDLQKQVFKEYFRTLIYESDLWKKVLTKGERDTYRLFLMVRILAYLKLHPITEEDKLYFKEQQISGIPDEGIDLGDAKYIRYRIHPAGNPEMYNLLVNFEEYLFDSKIPFFHPNYLKLAIASEKKHTQLITIYEPLLRNEFKFTDTNLAAALGISPPAVSKKRRKYEEIQPRINSMLITSMKFRDKALDY